MTYRDDLSAALLRNDALERELAVTRQRVSELENSGDDENEALTLDELLVGEIEVLPAPPNVTKTNCARGIQLSSHSALAAILARGEKEKAKELMRERRARERARRWKAREQAFEKRYQRYEKRRRRIRSCSPLSRAAHWLTPLMAPLCMLPFLALFILFHGARVVGLAIVMGMALLYALANAAGYWAWSRERKRSAKAPFPIQGHLEAIGSELRNPEIVVNFDDVVPSKRELDMLMTGLAAKKRNLFRRADLRNTTVEIVGRTATFSLPDFKTAWMAGNRGYLRWYRSLVEDGLTKLHRHAPIASLRVQPSSS